MITGDLTPECAAIVTAVLESLSAPLGADDTRSREQRYHDGLAEAMRRLAASGLLPERAGQPVKLWGHVSLAELRAMDDGSLLETEWVTEMRIRWSARRAEATGGTGGDGGAWLDGDAARALACDAAITPIVTGDVNPAVLDDLVALCLQLTGHGPRCHPQVDAAPRRATPAPLSRRTGWPCSRPCRGRRSGRRSSARPPTCCPARAASPVFLRTRQLGARLAGPACRWTSATPAPSRPGSATR